MMLSTGQALLRLEGAEIQHSRLREGGKRLPDSRGDRIIKRRRLDVITVISAVINQLKKDCTDCTRNTTSDDHSLVQSAAWCPELKIMPLSNSLVSIARRESLKQVKLSFLTKHHLGYCWFVALLFQS